MIKLPKLITVFLTTLILSFVLIKTNAIVSFTKSSQNPILTVNPSSWESNNVWQPSPILDGNTLKLWYSGYNGSRYQIGLATSTDGLTWNKNPSNPVVSRLSIDNKDAHDPTVIKNGTSYEMWYAGSDNGGASNFSIFRASSDDGVLWNNSSDPVFRPTSGWGSGGVTSPLVLKIDNQYKMWFSSSDTGHWNVGYATSSDGINWTPYANNPVLKPTQSWEGNDVDGSSVLYDGTTYEIFYHGNQNISYATSTDGINWTKPADKNPVLTRGTTFDNNNLAGAGALRLSNGTTMLYYGAQGKVDNVTKWRIGLATDGPIVLPTPTETPTPTPTLTPTPSPTPTPTPTPPVIIIPGMFASWNKDAILDNKTVPQSDWKMNSIVREYDGVKETLKGMGFTENTSLFLYPFDWRKKLEDAAAELDTYITAKIPGSQKVDIVGHSLGGLVGRIYAQKYGTGRIDKLITVGSPHQGVPQAYKTFAGGEIDRENTLQWLSLKLMLMLNRVDGKTDRQVMVDWMPVAHDLVPIYSFLTRLSDGSAVNPATMTYKNDTLLTYDPTFSSLFPLFQSIAGESAQTLLGFTVNAPTASDVTNNLYPDGRPASESKAIGDSTVVSQSAKADTDVKVLSAGHGELIYRQDGIKEIVSSLGYSIADSAITEGRATGLSPSLLFFIKSPATMTVEHKGSTTNETDGMIFLENAETGTYTLNVTGTGMGKYTVVVGQITTDSDYWENIAGEITKDPPSSQTDTYIINYPSNPLFPTSSTTSTGGGSSGGTSGTTTSTTSTTTTTTPTTSPTSGLGGWLSDILGVSDEIGSTQSASASGKPAAETSSPYQSPQPNNPWRFIFTWWLIGSGLFLLLIAFILSLWSKKKK